MQRWAIWMGCGLCVLATTCAPQETPTPLTVTLTAAGTLLPVGSAITLTAEAAGGTLPYQYRWTQERGPEATEFAETNGAVATTREIETEGEYVYRVVVTDATGGRADDYLTVTMGPEDIVVGEFNLLIEGPETASYQAEITLTSVTDRDDLEYLWEVTAGDATLSAPTAEETTVTLNSVGQVTVQLTGTDNEANEFKVAEYGVEVPPAITLRELPAIAIAGEPVELSITIEPADADVAVEWTLLEGSGTFDDPTALTTQLTVDTGETLQVQVTVTANPDSETPVTAVEGFELVSADSTRPLVRWETSAGDFTFELYADEAPLTTANLLRYIDDGFYEDVLIHRIAFTQDSEGEDVPFVIQGGGFYRDESDEVVYKEPTYDPVTSEAPTGFSNGELYSISMALSSGDADSGTTQWFVNLTDNSFLDDQSFTVFGTVAEGREVLDAMTGLELEENPVLSGEVSFPAEDIVIQSVTRVTG